MHSAVLVLLIASGLMGVALGQTIIHETTKVVGETKHETLPTIKQDTGIWVKSTELPTKPSMHFWSHPKDLQTDLSSSLPLSKLLESSTVSSVTMHDLPSESTLPEKLNTLGIMDKDCRLALELTRKNNEILELFSKHYRLAKDILAQTLEGNVCTIELKSIAHRSSNPEVKHGYIQANGVKVEECSNKVKPRLLVGVFHPINCSLVDVRHFHTDVNTSDHEANYFVKFVENLGDHLVVVGTSCGDSITGLGDGKTLLEVFNAPVDDVKPDQAWVFAFIKGKTAKGHVMKGEDVLQAQVVPIGLHSKQYELKMTKV